MKRFFCALIAALLLFTTATIAVSAEENEKYEKLLLLGDSITYGYGLEGDRDTCRSYGNQLREHLGVKWENFTNAAVNGDTSANLLALLPTIDKEVKEADLIVVTIGGNDMLGIIWDAADAIGGVTGDIYSKINDPVYTAKFLEQITMDVITETIIEYSVNLAAIVSYIRSNNPEARVLFLAQYDPASGITELGALGKITSAALKLLNIQMRESAEAGGCEYVDVHTPFEGKGAEWTNMLSADIHPNQVGHDKIFEIVADYLANTPAEGEESETAAPETEAPAEETTDAPAETEAPSETANAQPETEAPETSAPETDAPETLPPETDAPDTDSGEKKGCGSTLTGGAGVIALTFSAAIFMKKKRNGR